jgi:hypothetical protein
MLDKTAAISGREGGQRGKRDPDDIADQEDRRQRPERVPTPRLWTRKRERPELESYDEYFRVITRLDEKTRVVECKDRIQWIVQRLKVSSGGQRVWAGVSFCRSKEALLRCVREWVPGEHRALAALPDWFPAAGANRGADLPLAPATNNDADWIDWPAATDGSGPR